MMRHDAPIWRSCRIWTRPAGGTPITPRGWRACVPGWGDELLDAAWDAVPAALRLPATWTLRAHLDKLREEGRMPDGV